MAYEVTANTSVVAQLLPQIEKWSQPNQPLVKQFVLARGAVVALAAAAVFDAILHTIAAVVRAPIAGVKLVLNGLPQVKVINRINYSLSGFANASDVGRHAARVVKCAAEAFIIPISFVNPKLAAPLHARIGMYKPQPLPVSFASIRSKAWNVMTSRQAKVTLVAMAAIGLAAFGAHHYDLVSKLSQIDFKSMLLRRDFGAPKTEPSVMGSWIKFLGVVGVLSSIAAFGAANSNQAAPIA